MLLVLLFSFIITSFVNDNSAGIWVEFCNYGTVGTCLPKQGGGAGFRCYVTSIGEIKDCNGSRWVDI
jgi:hypothetical protein